MGFLGGCIGIISGFKGCVGEKSHCLAMTALYIGEGLWPIVWGLGVGISVLWMLRYLDSCVDELTLEMSLAAGVLRG